MYAQGVAKDECLCVHTQAGPREDRCVCVCAQGAREEVRVHRVSEKMCVCVCLCVRTQGVGEDECVQCWVKVCVRTGCQR